MRESDNDLNIYSIPDDSDSLGGIGSYVLEEDEFPASETVEEAEAELVEGVEEEYEDDDDDNEAWKGEVAESRPSAYLLMLRILATPIEGWKALKRKGLTTEEVASGCFYPLVALASLGEFTSLIYGTHTSVTEPLIPALVTFITFFLGYFSTVALSSVFLPKEVMSRLNRPFGKQYVMMGISTLAFFYLFYRIVPFLGPIVAFLPLWTIYVTCKGVKILRIPKNQENRTKGVLSAMEIGCPLLINWIVTEMFPL